MMEKTTGVLEDRKKKTESLKAMGIRLYPAGFRCDLTVSEAIGRFGALDSESLEKVKDSFKLAGRIMGLRDFGKACFIHIKDRTGRIQAYVRKDKLGEDKYKIFKLMDFGDLSAFRDLSSARKRAN